MMVVALMVQLLGCGRSVQCEGPSSVVAVQGGDSLSCQEAGWAIGYVEVVAARRVIGTDRREALKAIRDEFQADPAATRDWLVDLRERGRTLASGVGLEGAEARSRAVYLANAGKGPITADHAGLWSVQKRLMAVWSADDEEDLALTEADIEGWISYASLCREAQGGALRISVADRVTVYRMVRERFDSGTRANQIALSFMGGAWPRVVEAWPAASYETQQAWIRSAPLPGPMTATSLGYIGIVFDGDVVRHATELNRALGPLTMGPQGPMWSAEVPPP